MDVDLHAGTELIKNDPNKQNNNGLLFCEFLKRNAQFIVTMRGYYYKEKDFRK